MSDKIQNIMKNNPRSNVSLIFYFQNYTKIHFNYFRIILNKRHISSRTQLTTNIRNLKPNNLVPRNYDEMQILERGSEMLFLVKVCV